MDLAVQRLEPNLLDALPSAVARPGYDRGRVQPGIVHLGVGAFHRAHQAVLVDDCLADGDMNWGIVAASLRSTTTRDALQPQDGLYTLAICDSSGTAHRVVGAILRVLVAPEAPAALLDALTDPGIKIVTLTITEKGYYTDLASRSLRAEDPDILHDLAVLDAPRTALGFLVEAIARRRASGSLPFTVLSCDNLPNNGRTLLASLVQFATARDPELGSWMEANISCPSSMVDRIVPATTDADRTSVAAAIGAEDAWPVVCEPFLQWVIEDRFPSGRPALERYGAEFVTDVAPYEHMKLRLLNGTHTTIAAIGRLAGYDTVSAAIADPTVRRLIQRYWYQVAPTLKAINVAAYTQRLLARYANTALPHKTAQIAMDASLKVPQRILAPLAELRATQAPNDALVFAVAAWIRSCGGYNDAGQPFEVNDPQYRAWLGAPDQRSASPDAVIAAFLGLSAVFGAALPQDPSFAADLRAAYTTIATFGVQDGMRQYLDAAQFIRHERETP
jgi:fructuronate reductase